MLSTSEGQPVSKIKFPSVVSAFPCTRIRLPARLKGIVADVESALYFALRRKSIKSFEVGGFETGLACTTLPVIIAYDRKMILTIYCFRNDRIRDPCFSPEISYILFTCDSRDAAFLEFSDFNSVTIRWAFTLSFCVI